MPESLSRRDFLRSSGAAGLSAALVGPAVLARAAEAVVPSAKKLPRWRGFNLIDMFLHDRHGPFQSEDFALLEEWGFDFVRLPLSYRCWAKAEDPYALDEAVLKRIDAAVDLGKKHHVHVNVNLHRAPGYCVNPPKEPKDLWKDEDALKAAAFQWAHFAKRYKGRPSSEVSFDLLNEPANVSEEDYARVVRRLVEAIRAADPSRLIVADGLRWGRDPVHAIADLGVAQSTRGYDPMEVSHWKASWVGGSEKWAVPTWPLRKSEKDVWDRDRLLRDRISPWKVLEAKGVGVHVGEWGAHQHTPHDVVLAWMRDQLSLWREAGWGWSLWNLRGSFGVLDSRRKDVKYEKVRGHDLDRAMLEVLRAG